MSTKQLSINKAKQLRKKAWNKARPAVLKSIANTLCRQNHDKQWFCAAELLPDDLPNSTSLWTQFRKAGSTGTQYLEVEDKVVFRHMFGSDFYLFTCRRDSCDGNGSIESAAMAATADKSSLEVARASRHLRMIIESECKDYFKALKRASLEVDEAKARNTNLFSPEGPTTREAALVQDIIHSPPEESYAKMQALDSPARKRVHSRMVEGMLELDDLKEELQRIRDTPTAMSMLEQFNDAFVNKAFVERVVSSKETLKSGSIAPRASGFDDMSERSQREVSTVLAAIAMRVAQILVPQDTGDGHCHLLRAMVDNGTFRRFVFPNCEASVDNDKDYESWSKHPAVQRIKMESWCICRSKHGAWFRESGAESTRRRRCQDS